MSTTTNSLTADELRSMVTTELLQSGWTIVDNTFIAPKYENKQEIRNSHKYQRIERSSRLSKLIVNHRDELMSHFANGHEINPQKFSPEIIEIDSSSPDNNLFRFATLLWSIPVSQGYGRRMRYIVRDRYNGKLVGIFGLMDPVFNLKVRDQLIGWDHFQREDRLYNMLDAYVLGSVPPYNKLLGGKMIALAAISDEVRNDFRKKYSGKKTIIRGQEKEASLVLITTTSALGKSSIYNRIKLPDESERAYQSIGFSGGWGHFHISEPTFKALRDWLREQGPSYADRHKYKMGPNWRFRTIRQALALLGFEGDSLKHGIKREVYLAPLAKNYSEYLRGEEDVPEYYSRGLSDISEFFKDRWMIPRSQRMFDWCNWTREMTWAKIAENLESTLASQHQLNLF